MEKKKTKRELSLEAGLKEITAICKKRKMSVEPAVKLIINGQQTVLTIKSLFPQGKAMVLFVPAK